MHLRLAANHMPLSLCLTILPLSLCPTILSLGLHPSIMLLSCQSTMLLWMPLSLHLKILPLSLCLTIGASFPMSNNPVSWPMSNNPVLAAVASINHCYSDSGCLTALYLRANKISQLKQRLLVIFNAPPHKTGNLLGSFIHSMTCISVPSHKMHHITGLREAA